MNMNLNLINVMNMDLNKDLVYNIPVYNTQGHEYECLVHDYEYQISEYLH